MKEVIVIVRPERWRATVEAIAALGVADVCHQRVLGRGRQRGLRYLRRAAPGHDGDMHFLPKRLIRCLVDDATVGSVVDAVIKVNQTGNVGDGKVFVRALTAYAAAQAVEAASTTSAGSSA